MGFLFKAIADGLGQFKTSNPYSLADPFAALVDWGGISKSGSNVNAQTALQVTTVLACTRVLAEGIASLPFRIIKKDKNKKRSVLDDHPVHELLHFRPNSWQTPCEWVETTMFNAVLTGNAYSLISRVGPKNNRRIKELIPLSGHIEIIKHKDLTRTYKITPRDGNEPIEVSGQDVFHFRGPSMDGFDGLDIVKLAREAIGLAIVTEETHARLHSNGARPGGIITSEGNLTDEQLQRLKASWDQTQGGVANAMKTAVLQGGLTFQQLTMSGVDTQHIETRKYQVEEICRAMRVFPVMVMHSDKTSTFASAEQFFIAHVVHSLLPWALRLEQSVNRDFLTLDEQKSGISSKLSLQGLLRGAAKDRADYYNKLWNIGSLSPNEIREFEDMSPYEGGDEYRVPMNSENANGPDEDENPGDENPELDEGETEDEKTSSNAD